MKKEDIMDNKFYVYLHRDDSGMVRYVGKGHGRRAYEFRKKLRNPYWCNVFKNTKPIVEIAIANLSEEHAFELETMLYDIFLADGHKLTNIIRPDGQGVSGYKHTDEHKKKLSEAHSGENNPLYGKTHSDETRKKMSEAKSGENHPLYGKTHSDETRKKMSESSSGELNPNYGKTLSDETREKMSEAHSGEKSSSAKLTEKEVLEIRELYATGNYTQKELGLKYNVNRCTICDIINRRTWKHI